MDQLKRLIILKQTNEKTDYILEKLTELENDINTDNNNESSVNESVKN